MLWVLIFSLPSYWIAVLMAWCSVPCVPAPSVRLVSWWLVATPTSAQGTYPAGPNVLTPQLTHHAHPGSSQRASKKYLTCKLATAFKVDWSVRFVRVWTLGLHMYRSEYKYKSRTRLFDKEGTPPSQTVDMDTTDGPGSTQPSDTKWAPSSHTSHTIHPHPYLSPLSHLHTFTHMHTTRPHTGSLLMFPLKALLWW